MSPEATTNAEDLNKKQPMEPPASLPNPDQVDLDQPLAPKLLAEFYGGMDVNGDGSIYGIDFMFMDSKNKPMMFKTIEEKSDEWPNPAPSFEVLWEDYIYWATKVSRIPGVIGYLGCTNIGPASPEVKKIMQESIGTESDYIYTEYFGKVLWYKVKRVDNEHVLYTEYLDVNSSGSISKYKVYEVTWRCKYKTKPYRIK